MSEVEKGRMENGAEIGNMDERSVDETLRMIARMPAPEGLEERVKVGLRLAEKPGRLLAWPRGRRGESVWVQNSWVRSGWARGAAAAAIALVVVGGGWGIYTRVGPSQAAKVVALPQTKPSGAFSEAGAMRRPQTLMGPTVAKPTEPKAGQPAPKKAGTTQGAGASGAAKAHAQVSASHVIAPTQ
jgi:hypothetical protein